MMGNRISFFRKEKGISQAQLAERVNISASAIGMYEQGRREPSVNTLIALARVLGVSVDDLVSGSQKASYEVPKIAGILVVLQASVPIDEKLHFLGPTDLGLILKTLSQK